jgi:hypothetical protein
MGTQTKRKIDLGWVASGGSRGGFGGGWVPSGPENRHSPVNMPVSQAAAQRLLYNNKRTERRRAANTTTAHTTAASTAARASLVVGSSLIINKQSRDDMAAVFPAHLLTIMHYFVWPHYWHALLGPVVHHQPPTHSQPPQRPTLTFFLVRDERRYATARIAVLKHQPKIRRYDEWLSNDQPSSQKWIIACDMAHAKAGTALTTHKRTSMTTTDDGPFKRQGSISPTVKQRPGKTARVRQSTLTRQRLFPLGSSPWGCC